MIKVLELFNSPNGTKEHFELYFKAADFPDLPLKGNVDVKGEFLRVEEGISMNIIVLTATQLDTCVRCGKELTIEIDAEAGEWLFYEKRPQDCDDENELLFITRKTREIDPLPAFRQDLILNLQNTPRCPKECVHYEEPSNEVKALAGLKDLL